MNIDTLQIKRVTSNWDTHKSYRPEPGEMVLIALEDVDTIGADRTITFGDVDVNITSKEFGGKLFPIFVFGNKNRDTLEALAKSPQRFIEEGSLQVRILETLEAYRSGINPNNVDTTYGVGDSKAFARADHTHGINKKTITDVLKDGNFEYHGIQIGTADPTDELSGIKGSIGDIYIRYEATPQSGDE